MSLVSVVCSQVEISATTDLPFRGVLPSACVAECDQVQQ